jgi:hypothetical protein
MADERDTPSLEPPSLFGRKKKPAAPPQPAAPPAVSRPARRPVEVDDTPTTIFDDTSEPTPDVGPSLVSDEVPTPARTPRGRWLRGRPAAVVTGLLVGALIVGATAGSLRICTKVKGTSSCGDQGFFLLVAILVVAVLVGTAVLRVAHVPEPGSISFLAVGLLSVVTLLFLVDSIFEWWMVIAIPLVSVAMFLAAHWVATTYIDPAA